MALLERGPAIDDLLLGLSQSRFRRFRSCQPYRGSRMLFSQPRELALVLLVARVRTLLLPPTLLELGLQPSIPVPNRIAFLLDGLHSLEASSSGGELCLERLDPGR